MKADLDLKVIKALSLAKIPGKDAKGRDIWIANPKEIDGKPNPAFVRDYILWDSHRSAPPGFGLRVAGKKTYVIRRKVLGKSIMPTVGNVADFAKIDDARARAAELARKMTETGQNPNELARQQNAAELTLGEALAKYRRHLVTRQQRPARVETLRVYDRVARKFEEWKWADRKVRELTPDEIMTQFAENNEKKSANEQRFRTASQAVRWCIDIEALSASVQNREPNLKVDPFSALALHGSYRTGEDIEAAREEQSKRNPLRPSTSLGQFLEAAWSKKDGNDNETGIHFLMLMLLWGCRKSEHAQCVWGELLAEHGEAGRGRKATSHVWLRDHEEWGPYVFFHKTKNGRNHRLPITPMAAEILRRRQISAAKEAFNRGLEAKSRPFVFPARNKTSKSGHYGDAKDLLGSLREEIGVEKLTPHDLRRSFGAVTAKLNVDEVVKRRFFNHSRASVTDTYTQAEWAMLREWMEKIEQAIIVSAPNVFNSLKPASWPPIPAPEPHVCKPPKPRTGRPRKAALAAKGQAS
jgi:integrase